MRILGIDPGSQATGYGVIERDGAQLRHVAHGTLRPRGDSPELRLHHLYRMLCEVIVHHEPDTVAVERVFVAQSPRSALVLGQARGVALAALGSRALPVVEYSPAEVKQAVTGSGRADKRQVALMVRRLLGLGEVPHDAADALAAAIGHAQAGALRALGALSPRRRSPGRTGLAALHVRRAR